MKELNICEKVLVCVVMLYCLEVKSIQYCFWKSVPNWPNW